jgi:hypothetical protein
MKIFTRLAAMLAAASIATPVFACGLMNETTSAQANTPAPAVAKKDSKAAQPQQKKAAPAQKTAQTQTQTHKVATN